MMGGATEATAETEANTVWEWREVQPFTLTVTACVVPAMIGCLIRGWPDPVTGKFYLLI